MDWTIVIMGVVITTVCSLVVWVMVSIERYRSSQIKKWQSLPNFKIYCDMIYKKQDPRVGSHVMPEHLWWSPECPIFGETREEMEARCARYNSEKGLCE